MVRKHTLSLIFFVALAASNYSASAQEVSGITSPYRSAKVGSPVQDLIKRVIVKEGQTVSKGESLVELRSEKEAIDVERYKKVIAKREFDYNTSAKLHEDNAIVSEEQVLEKKIELELAQADLELARRRLEEKTIQSPIDGIVVEQLKEEGEPVDRAEPVMRVVNIDKLYLRVFVAPAVMEKLRKGMQVPVKTVGASTSALTAGIEFINPHADSSTNLFQIKLVLENPAHKIKAGIRMTADFTNAK